MQMMEAAQSAETETETEARVAAAERAFAELTETCGALRRRNAALTTRLKEHTTLVDPITPDSLRKRFQDVVEAATLQGGNEVGGGYSAAPRPSVHPCHVGRRVHVHVHVYDTHNLMQHTYTLGCPLMSHPQSHLRNFIHDLAWGFDPRRECLSARHSSAHWP